MVEVSILTTVFNGERFLRSSLESALGQRGVEFEVVVVDDGSNDATGSILGKFRDSRLRLVHAGRLGRAKALNLGIEHCAGRYIAILDADDIALPDRLLHSVAALRNNPRRMVVGSRYRTYIDESGNPTGAEDVMPMDFAEIFPALNSGKNPLFHSSVTMVKSALLEVGGYDEGLLCWEDLALYVKIAKCHELSNVDHRLSLKRLHPRHFFGGRNGIEATPAAASSKKLVAERAAALLREHPKFARPQV